MKSSMKSSLPRSIAAAAAIAFVAIAFAAHAAPAQDPLTAAKNAAKKAAAATNAHIAAEQNTEGQKTGAGAKKSPADSHRVEQKAAGSLGTPATATASALPPTIMREVFDYSRDGRRDPFYSLLMTTELRPTLSDLTLVGILVDHVGGRSVATLRDLSTNAHYPVTVGSTLGRMRVSAIKLKSVIFTIDEFGTTRQDSLVLRDSTKVRKP